MKTGNIGLIYWCIYFSLLTGVSGQNVGINSQQPVESLQLGSGNIYIEEPGSGIILKSPNGNCWTLKVSDSGVMTVNGIVCPELDSVIYESQTYSTKLMPDGRWWMTENLNIGTMINGANNMADNGSIEKYCYNDVPANCDIYGGLYQWDEMMQYTTLEGAKGICPVGWHLPTNTEWVALENALPGPDKGSRIAGNESLWPNGVLDQSSYFGSSGFMALPAGYRALESFSQGYNAAFWTSTQSSSTFAWFRYLIYVVPNIFQYQDEKYPGFSVRCVKD